MNIFTKILSGVAKIIVTVVLLYFTYLLFLQKDWQGIWFGLALLVFVTLPTIFVVYFKNKFVQKSPTFAKIWKFLRVIYILIIVLFVLFMALVAFRAYQQNQTAKAVEIINSTKITLDDVMGKNLPPEPIKLLNDSTIAGFDVNNNGIRDDVELAIFKKYPNSAKIRSAELQYAQALQLELTQVFNSETLVAVLQKEGLAYQCMGDIIVEIKNLTIEKTLSTLDEKNKEINEIVLNTDSRLKKQSDNYKKYIISYASLSGDKCDIELLSLPN